MCNVISQDITNIGIFDSYLKIFLSFETLFENIKSKKLENSPLISRLNKLKDKDKDKNSNKNRVELLNFLFNDYKDLKDIQENNSHLFINELLKIINKEIKTTNYDLINNISQYNIKYKPSNNEEKKSYEEFFNQFLPVSYALDDFLIIIKNYYYGKCNKCKTDFNKYIFGYKLGFDIESKKIAEYTHFSEILEDYLSKIFNKDEAQICDYCKKNEIFKYHKTIIKLPKILIFTIKDIDTEETINPNKIDLNQFIDESLKIIIKNTKYEILAIKNVYNKEKQLGTLKNISLFYKKMYSYEEDIEKEPIINNNNDVYENDNICGIENVGNNCYLNSGLQIINRFKPLVDELKKPYYQNYDFISVLNEVLENLQSKKIYNPTDFIKFFCKRNKDYIEGAQCCSQSFIRTLIKNINQDILIDYDKNIIIDSNEIQFIKYKHNEGSKEKMDFKKFIKEHKIFPQSKAFNLISGITLSVADGNCINNKCDNKNEIIKEFSFLNFIDYQIYLDNIRNNQKAKFSEILFQEFGEEKNMLTECPHCKTSLILKEKTVFIKIPDILIFTLQRYINNQTNFARIIPNEVIDLTDYIDISLKENKEKFEYELFAINVRYGHTSNIGHEICIIKINDDWYKIDDERFKKIKDLKEYFQYSYGLFYRKMQN